MSIDLKTIRRSQRDIYADPMVWIIIGVGVGVWFLSNNWLAGAAMIAYGAIMYLINHPATDPDTYNGGKDESS